MEQMSVSELNEYYLEALQCIGMFLLNESDNTIEYELFEHFDGSFNFLYEDTLNELPEAECINKAIKTLSLQLKDNAVTLLYNDENERLAKFVRNNEDWHEVFRLADKIKEDLSKL